MKQAVLLICLCLGVFGNLVTLNTQCPDQYVPNSNNICIRPFFLEGCQTYKNVYDCDVCSNGYDKVEGKCVLVLQSSQVPASMIGCLRPNGAQCDNCANGYRSIKGVCEAGVRFCENYDNENRCIKCNNEYSLIFGECRHNILLGCKVEKADHTCQECYKPFILDNYQCVIPSCKSYNDYGCYACECGFYIGANGSCQKMQNGCLKTYRGTCVDCLPHYKLKGGACVIEGCVQFSEGLCAGCQSDYELVEGTCRFINCFDWKDDTCLICNEGFNLVGGKCVGNLKKFVCEG